MVEPTIAHEERLRYCNPFVTLARKLLNALSKLSIRAAQQTDYKWDAKCSEGQLQLRLFVPRPSARSLDMGLPRLARVRSTAFLLVIHAQMGNLLQHQPVNVSY